jgi:MATE family multidrug resistance protein
MNAALVQRWRGAGGCAQVLQMALPLLFSTSANTIQMFINRFFLMWYSSDAMSASVQAAITSFAFASLFVGTAIYVNTFVAQYTGAGRLGRVGPAVWQGIYFSVAAGTLLLGLIPLAGPIFDWIGHAPAIRQYETIYFKIMCLGAIPTLVGTVVSGFYTGRGKMWVVMCVNFIGAGVNVVLDYCLIFGHFGFPRWGVAGAAVATVMAQVTMSGIYLWLFFGPQHRRDYNSVAGRAVDLDLLGRLVRYGLPNGIQFMMDVSAFTLFIAFVGRISDVSLAATVMAFQINTLAFFPALGLGVAVSTLVGQALGRNDPRLAQRSTWSAFYMTFGYTATFAAGCWFVPEVFIYLFAARASAGEFAAIAPVAKTLLMFVAFYSLFDTGSLIFSGALKGAGDTRFVTAAVVLLSWFVMVLPSYLAVKLGWGLYFAWGAATAYVCLLALVFLLRFLTGKWKSMRVIESVPSPVPAKTPGMPMVEVV